MPTILGANSVRDTGYNVANSLRLNDGDSPVLSKTASGAGNRKTWTISWWFKRSTLGTMTFFWQDGASTDHETKIAFDSSNRLFVYDFDGSSFNMLLKTNRLFRDVSAWYHAIIAVDTTDGTAANRIKMYINGVQETSFETATYPSQDHDTEWNSDNELRIAKDSSGEHFDGYITEIVNIDGSQLAQTSFGEFDEDSPTIWRPINVSALTFGTNGFHLDFEDSSSLGNDVSGNNNDFSPSNLAAIDQSTDTCTNNFATMNSIDNLAAGSAFSEGNLKIVTTGSNITYNTSTIGFSSGKWYMETKLSGSSGYTVGVIRGVSEGNNNDNKLGNRADGFSYDDGGIVENSGGTVSGTSGYSTYASGDIIGVYTDLDNNKLYFSKNGSLQSSTGIDITAGTYFFAVGDNNASNSSTYEVNFGGTNTYSVSSGNTDGTYGNFEYSTTITGDGASKTFKALNTKNLAEFG